MAKIKVLGGDLHNAAWTVRDDVLVIGSTPAHPWVGERLTLTDGLISIEQLSSERLKKLSGTAGWGFLGYMVLGPLGAIGGMLVGGNRTDVTFAAELGDGRKFVAQTDPKTFALLTMHASARERPPSPDTHVICPDCRGFVPREARKCGQCGCGLVPQ